MPDNCRLLFFSSTLKASPAASPVLVDMPEDLSSAEAALVKLRSRRSELEAELLLVKLQEDRLKNE